MTTPELVDILLSHPVTPLRAKKLLRHLSSPEQLTAVVVLLPFEAQQVLTETLTPPLVAQHFAQR